MFMSTHRESDRCEQPAPVDRRFALLLNVRTCLPRPVERNIFPTGVALGKTLFIPLKSQSVLSALLGPSFISPMAKDVNNDVFVLHSLPLALAITNIMEFSGHLLPLRYVRSGNGL